MHRNSGVKHSHTKGKSGDQFGREITLCVEGMPIIAVVVQDTQACGMLLEANYITVYIVY